ncbi:MAG: hypothetical protein E7408_07175 [Ruminococcaceae bacterium]|nr:hypothetical protein [Oscillospiraceae bacterium]
MDGGIFGHIQFTDPAKKELSVLCDAVSEILSLTHRAFVKNDLQAARDVEPLEQVIDSLKAKLRDGHIKRLKNVNCSIEAGFVWADLINDLERTADHCSNIAVCILDAAENTMHVHQSLQRMKNDNSYFNMKFAAYTEKYRLS